MATRDIVMQSFETQRSRFLEEKTASDFLNWNRTMQYFFYDTGEYFYIKLVNGKPDPVVEGKAEKAEIEYQMDTDTFIAITVRQLSGLKAYTQGRVKLKASLPDMLKLQKLA